MAISMETGVEAVNLVAEKLPAIVAGKDLGQLAKAALRAGQLHCKVLSDDNATVSAISPYSGKENTFFGRDLRVAFSHQFGVHGRESHRLDVSVDTPTGAHRTVLTQEWRWDKEHTLEDVRTARARFRLAPVAH